MGEYLRGVKQGWTTTRSEEKPTKKPTNDPKWFHFERMELLKPRTSTENTQSKQDEFYKKRHSPRGIGRNPRHLQDAGDLECLDKPQRKKSRARQEA